MRSWMWVVRYALVLLIALLLGAGIGELTVFKQTTLGTPKLSAAALARFLGYGGALVIFWMMGQRASNELRAEGTRTASVGLLLLPLTTLIALAAGYDVLLVILRPFLSATPKDIYNWLFVIAILGSAIWLVAALYRHADGIVEILQDVPPLSRAPRSKCLSCGAPLAVSAKFCSACGKPTAATDAAS